MESYDLFIYLLILFIDLFIFIHLFIFFMFALLTPGQSSEEQVNISYIHCLNYMTYRLFVHLSSNDVYISLKKRILVSNIGFITVHGINEGHIAPYTYVNFNWQNNNENREFSLC